MFIPETVKQAVLGGEAWNECERWPKGGALHTGLKCAFRLSGESVEERSLDARGTSQGAAEWAASPTPC